MHFLWLQPKPNELLCKASLYSGPLWQNNSESYTGESANIKGNVFQTNRYWCQNTFFRLYFFWLLPLLLCSTKKKLLKVATCTLYSLTVMFRFYGMWLNNNKNCHKKIILTYQNKKKQQSITCPPCDSEFNLS